MHALEMIGSHPEVRSEPVHGVNVLKACVEACFDCALTCTRAPIPVSARRGSMTFADASASTWIA